MKIAIVGPTHPYKGGIAQHTTQLAHHLKDAGHDVSIISWRSQYPFFYPGEQFVPDGIPEMPVFKNSQRVLSWKNPFGWIVQARRLRQFDKVIFVWWVPLIQGFVYPVMVKALGKHHPKLVLLCHNITSHSSGSLDKTISRITFNSVDKLLVHTPALADQARELTNTPIIVAAMPAHLPGQPKVQTNHQLSHQLLFFGLVRHYKGVDVLIKALANLPNVKLTIAGEMWGKQETNLRQLITDSNLQSRVKLLPGYVPAESIATLFAESDALVMPYRSGTASQNAELAFAYGRPVIATTVGSAPEQISDKFNGLLCAPDDVEALSRAITYFYQADVAQKLLTNVKPVNPDEVWSNYLQTIIA